MIQEQKLVKPEWSKEQGEGKQLQAQAHAVPILKESLKKLGLLEEMANSGTEKCPDRSRGRLPTASPGCSKDTRRGIVPLPAFAKQSPSSPTYNPSRNLIVAISEKSIRVFVMGNEAKLCGLSYADFSF